MPTVVGPIIDYLGTILVSTWITIGITVASTAYSYLSRPDAPETPLLGLGQDLGYKINTRSTEQPIPIVYGIQRVGGNDIFCAADGAESKYLWIVQTLSEGVCDSINTSGGADQIWLGDRLESDFGSLVSYWFHDGASDQTVDSNLSASVPAWTDCLRNTCYIVWKLEFNRDYFQGLPARTVELKGKEVYDFRDGTTAWYDNPVLCLYDFVTNARYGLGIASTSLDLSSWISAANYCDAKNFTLNMVVNTQEAGIDVVNSILAHFRGALVWFDGSYYLRYCDTTEESSCMTLTDAHIIQDEKGKAAISVSQPSMFDKPDAVCVRWVDPDNNYVVDNLMVGDDTGVVKTMDLLGCTDKEMASNLGVYNLERWKLDRVITGRFRGDALQLEPNDICTLTSTAVSVSGQLMRVREANILADQSIELVLAYEADALYDDSYDLLEDNVYTCSLPDPYAEPPPVANAAVTEETYNYRLRTFTRLKITFDEPTNYPWFDRVQVWLSYDDVTYEHIFDSTADFEIANVQEGENYYIRLKTVSIHGVEQADANDRKLSKLVTGYVAAPDSVAALYAIVTQNAVNLYADKLGDTDIELYEFRMGSSWSAGIFLAAMKAPNLSLAGVKPGTHTFLVNTLGNNSEYGDSPASVSAIIADPPDGWTVGATETCDYSDGTHDNTEQIDYGGNYYLKCSHTGGVLTGTYTSEIFDRGSSGRFLLYVLASVVVTGGGTTWDDIAPDPMTWASLDVSRTWSDICSLISAPQVKMRVLYGTSSPPTNIVYQMEILTAIVTGRYFQVEIEITDPSSDVMAYVENFTLKFCT